MKSKYIFKSNKFLLILVVLILLAIFLSLFFVNLKIKSVNKIYEIDSNIKNDEISYDIVNVSSSSDSKNVGSYLSIPAIKLYNIKIKDGIDESTLNEYIGHFPNTSNWNGNIGLAAHNRGYKNNYFENLKDLKEGEVVLYFYNNKCIEFIVKTKTIIKDTNWSYLEKTKDDRLTLITCVEDEKEYRRCIQCVKK